MNKIILTPFVLILIVTVFSCKNAEIKQDIIRDTTYITHTYIVDSPVVALKKDSLTYMFVSCWAKDQCGNDCYFNTSISFTGGFPKYRSLEKYLKSQTGYKYKDIIIASIYQFPDKDSWDYFLSEKPIHKNHYKDCNGKYIFRMH